MNIIDFDARFTEVLNRWIEDNRGRFRRPEDMEDEVPDVYLRWLNTPADWLEGCAPGISLDAETRDFFDMVKGKAQPADWQALSLNTAQVMEEARAALGIHFPPEVFAV